MLLTLIINNNVTNFFVAIVDFLELKVLRFATSVKMSIFFVLIARFLKFLELLQAINIKIIVCFVASVSFLLDFSSHLIVEFELLLYFV